MAQYSANGYLLEQLLIFVFKCCEICILKMAVDHHPVHSMQPF